MVVADSEVTGRRESGSPGGHLLDRAGTLIHDPTRTDVEASLRSGRFFWLNLARVSDEELGWMREVFGFHPLAIDDAVTFGERPKIEEYDDHILLVMYGSAFDDGIGERGPPSPGSKPDASPAILPENLDDVLEVHCYVSANFLVTVHRGSCAAFTKLAARLCEHGVAVDHPARLFHRVADILVDSFFPVLSKLDDRIDQVESDIIERPDRSQMGELLHFRHSLIGLRRVVTPQRDMFASLAGGVVEFPGLDDEAQRYYRDVYDHLIRLSDLIDGYRDLLSGATDAYLSVTSNQLNVVMKQLAIISTVFLPLSFLTGFFGQNFTFLTSNIGSWETFWFAGVGSEVLVVVSMMALFRARGWLGRAG
ncbi:MAG: magnesium transporter CorA family protein [Actinomycetota bacterium]|nr:magnesium transporter CorA family protein [Actinomycetota bacterium]